MTEQHDIPADGYEDIDCKILVETSFFKMAHELEDHLTHGWRVDPHNHPVHTFTHYEVALRKDRASINRVQERINNVIEARDGANKEKAQANVEKMHVARAEKSAARKTGKNVQNMLASIEAAKKGENDEGAI